MKQENHNKHTKIDKRKIKEELLKQNKKQCSLCLRVLDLDCFFKKISPNTRKIIKTSRCKQCFQILQTKTKHKKIDSYNATRRKLYSSRINTDLDKWREDVNFIQICNLMRKRIRQLINNKSHTAKTLETLKYIGCSKEDFKKHMHNTLLDIGATQEDYHKGRLHIDHITPFNYYIKEKGGITEENLYKVMHYTNIRFLWAKDNLLKGGKY
jgi:hypothetical protein